MGASTPHFALQLRERIRRLIARSRPTIPPRVEGEREIARLDALAFAGEARGQPRRAGARAAGLGLGARPFREYARRR